jgi:DNA-3-methyladenine glycosylase
VETEAYGYSDDLASHAYVGPTGRNKIMFGDVGKAYVYFTYGNHFCLNVSARRSKVEAGAILIRGIEPVEGIELMRQFRPVDDIYSLTSGPGKLTQALNITSLLNGTDMTNSESEIYIEFGKRPKHIVAKDRHYSSIGQGVAFCRPIESFYITQISEQTIIIIMTSNYKLELYQ